MSSRLDVLCDASPLITLGKLNRLEVLAELYGEIRIPRPVYDEVVTSGLAKGAYAILALLIALADDFTPGTR